MQAMIRPNTVNPAWEGLPLDGTRAPNEENRDTIRELVETIEQLPDETNAHHVFDLTTALAEALERDGADCAVIVFNDDTAFRVRCKAIPALDFSLSDRGIMPLYLDGDDGRIVLRESPISGPFLRIASIPDPAARARLWVAHLSELRAEEAELRTEKSRAIRTAQTTSELAEANALPETRRDLDQLAANILADREAARLLKETDPDAHAQLRLASSRTGVVDRPWVKKIGRLPFND